MSELPIRHLKFSLSESAYRELEELSIRSKRSITDLVRYGIGFMRVVDNAQKNNHRLMLVDENNVAMKEIVLPD